MDNSLPPVDASHVEALRRFNRFYTQRLGILAPYLGGDLTLTEVRVLYELAQPLDPDAPGLLASHIGTLLGLDAGYLSRILRRFEARHWVARSRSPQDGRQQLLRLTETGRMAFLPLQEKSRSQAASTLQTLDVRQRQHLIDALQRVQDLLGGAATGNPADVELRALQAGDLGWVVAQHGALYAREYGLNQEFEALVARIVADYVKKYQADWERGWIAQRGDERLGSAFVVRKSRTVAQLRLLMVLPQARGLGLGARLTDTCIAFARDKGYRTMVLWTNNCLDAARAIYAARGFVLRSSEPYRGFGQDLVGETWELRL